MTYIRRPHHSTNLFHRIEVRAQPSVHGKDLFVDDGRNRQAIEAVCECLPQLDVVPSLTLIVESVNAIDRGAFMVAAENEEILGVLDLVCQQQADGLERLLASVNVVTKK